MLGSTVVCLGLAILAYLAWQFAGTDYLSHRHQRQVLAQLQNGWTHRHDTVPTRWGVAEAIVEIPRFGPDYRVPLLEGTGPQVLAAGYGHITGTAGPGQQGNFAIAAHRVTHGEPLRNMPDLQINDQVRIVTRTTTYIYRLTSGGDDLIVPFTATWVTAPLPHNPHGGVEPRQIPAQRLLTLTTCAELFHTDNRMVAFGVLARVIPTAATQRRGLTPGTLPGTQSHSAADEHPARATAQQSPVRLTPAATSGR